jgi:hypothetical protein
MTQWVACEVLRIVADEERSDRTPIFTDQYVVGATRSAGVHHFAADPATQDLRDKRVVRKFLSGARAEHDDFWLELEDGFEIFATQIAERLRPPVRNQLVRSQQAAGSNHLFADTNFARRIGAHHLNGRAALIGEFHSATIPHLYLPRR